MKIIFLLSLLAFGCSLDYNSQLSWDGVCNTFGSVRQSPIDIPAEELLETGTTEIVSVDYNPDEKATLKGSSHGVTAELSESSKITVNLNGKELVYSLSGFHFHSLSEHSFTGDLRDLEMHLVHLLEEGEGPKYTVVSVTFSVGTNDSGFFTSVFNGASFNNAGIPKESTFLPDFNDFVSTKKGYYYYPGSLTTPPCTESVNWFVLREAQPISLQQYQRMALWLKKQFGRKNNRWTQPVYGRKITLVNPK